MERSPIRYAWRGETSLAYQVSGSGPIDLVYLQGELSNVELNWGHPDFARFLRDLGSLARLIVTDRRGLGCSERFTPADTPPIETLMDDVLAVLDETGAERPVLFATGDCGYIACLFAATHPDRLSALILFGAAVTWRRTAETPWGRTDAEFEEQYRWLRANIGNGSWTRAAAPSLGAGGGGAAWEGSYERLSITPGSCVSEARRFNQTDIRGVLPSVQVPTLVLHRVDDANEKAESGAYLASHIRTARLVELPGVDHFPWAGNQEDILREVRLFLRSLRAEAAELDRVLMTVVFTDIVDSTHRSATMGDHRWREVRDQHDRVVRAQLARYRGREIKTMGDGFLATFDGPVRAVRCARAITDGVRPLGIEVRAGVHTGEVQWEGDDITGIAVAIGARVAALAAPSEVLASQTVRDLVAGSGIAFEPRGKHTLKGVPGEWHLLAVTSGAGSDNAPARS